MSAYRPSRFVAAGARRGLRVSFEFFPPKTPEMEQSLWECVSRLAPLKPNFVSVTYGAGGSTRERTHATVKRILAETALTPAATKRLGRYALILSDLAARRRGEHDARVAGEPKRYGDFALRPWRQCLLPQHVEAGGFEPLRDRLGSKAEAAMRVLLAQEFEIVRGEIDHQQPPAGAQDAGSFGDGARTVVEKVQDLMDDDDIEGIARQREIVNIAVADAAVLEPGAIEPGAR